MQTVRYLTVTVTAQPADALLAVGYHGFRGYAPCCDDLEERQLVTRCTSAAEARTHRIQLTHRGRDVALDTGAGLAAAHG